MDYPTNHVVAILEGGDQANLAVEILRRCGGQFINFFGQFNVERIG